MTTGSGGLTAPGFARGTSNGIKAAPGLAQELWFELGTNLQSLPSNSRSIRNTPLKKKKKKKKGERERETGEKASDSSHPDGAEYLDFIRDNYLICFISALPQSVGRRTSGPSAVGDRLHPARGLWIGSFKHSCPRC